MKIHILCLIIFIFSLFSCSGRINGSVSADGSALFFVEISLGPRISSVIRSLNSAGGQDNSLILDGDAIAKSMSIDGITSAILRNTAPSAVEGEIRISNVNRFLSAGEKSGFIKFEQRAGGGNCVININLDNGPLVLENLSPEIADFLNALMAPIATGEVLSKSEYQQLIASFYNRTISDEIAASRIRASIEFPGAISNVKGGTFSGRRAEFDIPFLDLLVLETPLIFEVNWR
jgi:hypothetical protein